MESWLVRCLSWFWWLTVPLRFTSPHCSLSERDEGFTLLIEDLRTFDGLEPILKNSYVLRFSSLSFLDLKRARCRIAESLWHMPQSLFIIDKRNKVCLQLAASRFNDVINIASLSILVYCSCHQRLRWRNQNKNLYFSWSRTFFVRLLTPFTFEVRRFKPLKIYFLFNPSLPSPHSTFGICIRSIDWVLRKVNGNIIIDKMTGQNSF